MNICFFNLEEHYGLAMVGGVERATSLHAKELRRRGHHVEFFFTPSRRFPLPLVSTFLPSPSKRAAGKRFRQFLKEHKIDVAIWDGGAGHIQFPLNTLPCKLVTVWHNTPNISEKVYSYGTLRKVHSRWAKRLVQTKLCRVLAWKFFRFFRNRFFLYACRHSDKFVLLSESFFVDFAPWKKFPEKVCAIPNIAPYEAKGVSFDGKKKELLWVARMVFDQKRPDFMLKIWQRLQDRFPDWSLRFVGDGPCLPELKALAKELGVQRVSFEGFQDPAPYYRSAPIFCMTSAYEGFPMVLLEAQAFVCVPVAFDSFSAVHDIIEDGENGVLVSPFDLDVYVEKLSELMQDPTLRSQLGSAAQKSVARFSPETIGDKWEALFKELGL